MIRSDQKCLTLNIIYLYLPLSAFSVYLYLPFSPFISPFLFLSSSFPFLHIVPDAPSCPHSTVPCPQLSDLIKRQLTARSSSLLPDPDPSLPQKPVSCFPKKLTPTSNLFPVTEISHEYRLSNFFLKHKCMFCQISSNRKSFDRKWFGCVCFGAHARRGDRIQSRGKSTGAPTRTLHPRLLRLLVVFNFLSNVKYICLNCKIYLFKLHVAPSSPAFARLQPSTFNVTSKREDRLCP